MGGYDTVGGPQEFECRDERNRRYIEVGPLEFMGSLGTRGWLALTPLEPLKPGEPLPRRITFPMQVSVNTYQSLPAMHSGKSLALVQENLAFAVELSHPTRDIDIPALSQKYGNGGNISARGYVTKYTDAALKARADAWQELARQAIGKSIRLVRVSGRPPIFQVDAVKRQEAEQALQNAVKWTAVATKAIPHESAMLQAGLEATRQYFKVEKALK